MKIKYLYYFIDKRQEGDLIKIGEVQETFNIKCDNSACKKCKLIPKECKDKGKVIIERWGREACMKKCARRWKCDIKELKPLGAKAYGDKTLHRYLKFKGFDNVKSISSECFDITEPQLRNAVEELDKLIADFEKCERK